MFAWNNLGYTELLLEKYEDAAEHLAEATRRSGATGYMFNNLGTALEHLDRLDEARAAYEAAGKLGSKEAVASRKRLEGVKTIAIAKVDDGGSSHPEIRGDAKAKEYELTDEGDVTDEDEAMETQGSAASDEVESDKADDKKLDDVGGANTNDESAADEPEQGSDVAPVE